MNDSAKSGGMSLLGVLLVIFIVLKLVGVIDWSWWLVLIPLWISLGFFVLGFVIIGAITIIAHLRG